MIQIYRFLISIYLESEVIVRIIYWNLNRIKLIEQYIFRPLLKKFKYNSIHKTGKVDIDVLIEWVKKINSNEGDINIIHSTFEPFRLSNLTAKQVNDLLLEAIGVNGTLVMPTFRNFGYNYKDAIYRNFDFNSFIDFDPYKTPIITGFLPFELSRRKESYVSKIPINNLSAIGNKAERMMNLKFDDLAIKPHGKCSPWGYALDNDALVIGLGINFPKYLTAVHLKEDYLDMPIVKDWYNEFTFLIKNSGEIDTLKVLERKFIYGAFFYLEKKLEYDLINEGVLMKENIGGIDVYYTRLKKLYSFLESKNKYYPYSRILKIWNWLKS